MARRKASTQSATSNTATAEAPEPKRSPGRPKAPSIITYRFKRSGVTEGTSGNTWKHDEERTRLVDGNMVRWYEVEAPEGEFDHLYNEDGSSRYLLGKKQ